MRIGHLVIDLVLVCYWIHIYVQVVCVCVKVGVGCLVSVSKLPQQQLNRRGYVMEWNRMSSGRFPLFEQIVN